MSKIKTIVLLLSVFIFAFICETTLAESRKESENNFLLHNDAEGYMNFCTGFYLMLDHRWEEAIVFLEKTLQSNPNAEKIHQFGFYFPNREDLTEEEMNTIINLLEN